ncbi:MAG: hypothetical protein LIO91_08750 [Bacteroidales bacterium]|nr:hypothetical protein [Bacteroidales bacterium]
MSDEMTTVEMRKMFLDCYGSKVRGNFTPEGMWDVIENDILQVNDLLSLDFVDIENMIGGDVRIADGIVGEGYPDNLSTLLNDAFQRLLSLHPEDHPRKVVIFLETRPGQAAEASFTIVDFVSPLDDEIDFCWGLKPAKGKRKIKLTMLIGFN